MDINPYAATENTAEESEAGMNDDPDAVRHNYIAHETAIRAVGLLYFVGTFRTIVVATGILVTSMFDAQADPTDASQSDWLTQSLIGCVVFGIGLMQAFAGWSLRSPNDFGRPVAVLLACVGLLAIPIGNLISIYILYLLTSIPEVGVMKCWETSFERYDLKMLSLF